MYIILVGALGGIKAGMGLIVQRNYFKDSNVGRQHAVESKQKVNRVFYFFQRIKMHVKIFGMHARIGSAAAHAGNVVA